MVRTVPVPVVLSFWAVCCGELFSCAVIGRKSRCQREHLLFSFVVFFIPLSHGPHRFLPSQVTPPGDPPRRSPAARRPSRWLVFPTPTLAFCALPYSPDLPVRESARAHRVYPDIARRSPVAHTHDLHTSDTHNQIVKAQKSSSSAMNPTYARLAQLSSGEWCAVPPR